MSRQLTAINAHFADEIPANPKTSALRRSDGARTLTHARPSLKISEGQRLNPLRIWFSPVEARFTTDCGNGFQFAKPALEIKVKEMTDAELLRQFAIRERSWCLTLEKLRKFHVAQMGKATTSVQWMAGRELGRLSWLGYYWAQEMFWFGYGLRENTWGPLIEADNRSKHSETWQNMRTQLSGTWEAISAEGNLYRRLWASPGIAANSDSELEWFKARSCELHEYVVA